MDLDNKSEAFWEDENPIKLFFTTMSVEIPVNRLLRNVLEELDFGWAESV